MKDQFDLPETTMNSPVIASSFDYKLGFINGPTHGTPTPLGVVPEFTLPLNPRLPWVDLYFAAVDNGTTAAGDQIKGSLQFYRNKSMVLELPWLSRTAPGQTAFPMSIGLGETFNEATSANGASHSTLLFRPTSAGMTWLHPWVLFVVADEIKVCLKDGVGNKSYSVVLAVYNGLKPT